MLIFALVRDDGNEIYFDANSLTCYQRTVRDGIEFWSTTDGDDGYNLNFYHVDHGAFQRLSVERMTLVQQAAGRGPEIRDLSPCLPNGVKDCAGIMQIYLDACRPWPMHPPHNPVALEKLHYLDVSNMTIGWMVNGCEKCEGIMVSSEEHMHIRVNPMWAQYDLRRKRIIHWGTDIESIILDIKREQLLR